jgi:tetratricopeptide (TPR) repeat protein
VHAADALLDAIEALHPPTALEYRALFALPWFRDTPRDRLAQLRDALVRWDGSAEESNEEGPIGLHAPYHPYFRLYLLGLLSVRIGDEPAALAYASELERRAPSAPKPAFVSDLARTVRAEAAGGRGQPAEALRLLEGAGYWKRLEFLGGGSEFFSLHYQAFLYPELLYQLGHDAEALRWYKSVYDMFVFSPVISLRRAEIFERLGRHREAAEEYARFIDLWRDCDPELRPLVEAADQRRSRLSVERASLKPL